MENRIYLYDLPCFQNATEKQIKNMNMKPERYFDLNLLPTPGLQVEMQAFIEGRGETLKLSSIRSEFHPYKMLATFLSEKESRLNSFREKPLKLLIKELRAWLLKNGYKITYNHYRKDYGTNEIKDAGTVIYLKKIVDFLKLEDLRPEIEKDIWEINRIEGVVNLRDNPTHPIKSLNFTKIPQEKIRGEVKTAAFMELKRVTVRTVTSEISAINRLTAFLNRDYPQISSLKELDREIIEDYLEYINTEVTSKNNFRVELIHLNTILRLIGKVLESPVLDNVFLQSDFPRTPKLLFRSYSDSELIRLNSSIVNMNEQVARALIIHEILGTRISDTLALRIDCLYEKNGIKIVRIWQVKTHYYEKPVSDELAQLIKKSQQYSKEHYGKTEYLFVSPVDASKPMQYSMIQFQVMTMIRENDLRDDNGELFGFGTHLFRHTYGRKLTEMHLDDYTISRLLGHANVGSVKFYRKMSNRALELESKEMRETMDTILSDLIKGWNDYDCKQI